MRILAELLAALLGLCIKYRKSIGIFLVAFFFSLLMLGVATKYGRSPVPFPLLFVLIGTLFVMKNWK